MREHELRKYFAKHLGRMDRRQVARYRRSHVTPPNGQPPLKQLFISAAHECNANCVHCYEKFDDDKLNDSLAPGEIRDAIDQLHALDGFGAIFCSGEFLLRPDAIAQVEYARSKDLTTTLTTNGLLLTERMVDDLDRAGLTQLIVSIDSADEERHDRLRGLPGCYAGAVEGLRRAGERGIITHIWTYVSKSNFDQLAGISRLAAAIGVDLIFVYFPLLSGHLFNRPEEDLTFEEREQFRREFNDSLNVELEFPTEEDHCRGGGASHVNITPSGEVTFCPPVPYSYGNVRKRSLEEIVIDMRKDRQRFTHCFRGQCPVNSQEYRRNCAAEFLYPDTLP